MIPKRPHAQQDGKTIRLKQECRNGCKWYKHTTEQEYCGGGKYFKILAPQEKLPKCRTLPLIAKETITNHSLEYIELHLGVLSPVENRRH